MRTMTRDGNYCRGMSIMWPEVPGGLRSLRKRCASAVGEAAGDVEESSAGISRRLHAVL